MKPYRYLRMLILSLLYSCGGYLEIDPPKNQLVGEYVFDEAGTVEGALAHIYAGLRDSGPTSGSISGMSYLLGHYADELDHLSESQGTIRNFYNNSVLSADGTVNGLWNSSYGLIYESNRILEGVSDSDALEQTDKDRFMGEAYFIRALVHLYLTNMFGDIPYVDTTDYRANATVSRMGRDAILELLLADAQKARELLTKRSASEGRFTPDHWTAAALLARIYLDQGNWEGALAQAMYIISEGPFELEPDLDLVFQKTSVETLWQLDPGSPGTNTQEGRVFVAVSAPPSNTALSNGLLDAFEFGDLRLNHWVGTISDGDRTYHFPFKYKQNTPTGVTEECSVLFRLAEVYLIAAEAEAHLGLIDEARNHLNAIRQRASLPSLTITDQQAMFDAVLQERRVELFSELGHRFFDLKRMERADAELSLSKPFWEETDILLPLPENELLKNPNLLPQNEGY